jgi:DNA ligase-1
VFDSPTLKDKIFEDRMQILEDYFAKHKPPYASIVQQEKCTGLKHLLERLEEVDSGGGEGLMLRAPRSFYEPKR